MLTPAMVSFILPVFNEKAFIYNTLEKLHKYAPKTPYEVIIVDNGSTDETVEIAQTFGDTVLECPEGTIATVRNFGVENAKGDILVFLDGDVELTQSWQSNIESTILQLKNNPMIISGSRCLPPQNKTILNQHWFTHLVDNSSTTYINSGHLITTKDLFNKISGFDGKLKTAEDYDFCARATKLGAKILPSKCLQVIHHGYPDTFHKFIKRERWHGRQDFHSLSSILGSKVALVSTFHLLVAIISISLLFTERASYGLIFYTGMMFGTTVFLTLYKFKKSQLSSLFKTSFVQYLYLVGRTLSLIDRLTLKNSKNFR